MKLLANLRKNLGDRLHELRKARGWTQYDLAEESGVSVGSLRNYEQSRNWPDPEDIERLASALEVPPWSLFASPDDQPRPTPGQALDILAEAIGQRPPRSKAPRTRSPEELNGAGSPALSPSKRRIIAALTALDEDQPGADTLLATLEKMLLAHTASQGAPLDASQDQHKPRK